MSDRISSLNTLLEGRYHVERALGEGGAATVYLADDLRHRRTVAIKVLKPNAARQINIDRFSREIEIVASLTHPHILPLHDSGEVSGVPFFVMPHIDGGTLRDRLRSEGALPPGEAVRIALEIADALQVAHGESILHRDVKPENILFSHGHALLADFGIADSVKSAEGSEPRRGGMGGTPTYMSPDQAFGESEPNATWDLYSLGCVLFEMLTGRPPFVSSSREALVASHLTTPPPTLSESGVETPTGLQEVLDALLAKDSAGRPKSAAALLRLLGRVAEGPVSPWATDSGRPEEEARVLELLEAAEEGSCEVVLVEGDPGIGKSTLLASIGRRAKERGIVLLRGQGERSEGAAAYHAWQEVLEGALRLTGITDPEARQQAAFEALADDPELVRLAPLLNDVLRMDLPESDFTAGMDGASRAEAVQELAAGILRSHGRGGAMLLLLDDVQWFDGASWSLVLGSVPKAGTVVMVLASRTRSESFPGEVREWLSGKQPVRLRLAGLAVEAVEKVAEQAIGAAPLGTGLSQWLHRKSDGNPFYAREVALALVETGEVQVLGGRVVHTPTELDLDELALPSTVEELVLSRLDRLEPELRAILQAASVLGRGFDVEELGVVLGDGADPPALVEALDRLVANQLLMPEGNTFAFTHQITREVTYGTIEGEVRTRLHRRFAECLEGESPGDQAPDFARLAHHWREAGVTDKATEYLELATSESLRQGAYAEAVSFMSEVFSLDERLGGVASLHRRGHWNTELAQALVGLGRNPEGAEHAAMALEQLGASVPRTRIGWIGMAVRQALIQVLHRIRVRRTLRIGTKGHQRAMDVVAAADIQADHRYNTDDSTAQIAVILLAANTADRMEPANRVARPIAVVGALAHMLGLKGWGWRYLERAQEISSEARDFAALARAEMISSAIHFWSGDLHAAKEAFVRGERLAEDYGLRRELMELWGVASNIEMALGEYGLHSRRGRRFLEEVSHGSPTLWEVWGQLILAQNYLRLGRPNKAEEHIEELRRVASRLEHQERVSYEAAEVLLQLQRQDWPQLRLATSRLSESLAVGSRGRTMIWAHWQSFAALAEGRLALLEKAGNYDRRRAMTEVRLTCKAYFAFAKTYPVALSFAWLAKGRALLLEGKLDQASAALEKARGFAETTGDPYAGSRITHYRALCAPVGSPERADLLNAAHEAYEKAGCRWEARLVGQQLDLEAGGTTT